MVAGKSETGAVLSLKDRQRQERVELILEAAEAVLAEKSYYEMSMDEVAARVGIAKGTIYLHFPGKEDLVMALFQRTLIKYVEFVAQIAARPDSARSRLEALLENAYGPEQEKRGRMFMSIFSDANMRKETIAKQIAIVDFVKQAIDHVTAILEDGKTKGEFISDVPTAIMATGFMALLHRPPYTKLMLGDTLSAAEQVQYVARMYFNGISNRPA